jgi:hypothetical protein
MAHSNLNCGLEALSVGPEVESGEAVAAGVGRRQCDHHSASDSVLYRLNPEIASDREWAGRKFDEEPGMGVDVLVTLSLEPGRSHSFVEAGSRDHILNDEVEIVGLVGASCVEACTGSPGKDTADAGLG